MYPYFKLETILSKNSCLVSGILGMVGTLYSNTVAMKLRKNKEMKS